jgi:hypothetical protein
MAYTPAQESQYIQDILKEWYTNSIVNQVHIKAPVYHLVKKQVVSVPAGGKFVIMPVRTGLSEAVGPRVLNDYSLPIAGKVLYSKATIYLKRNYGRVQVDGFAMEQSKGKGGWIDIMTGETKGIGEAYAIEIDQQLMGRGTAVLGHVSDGSKSTSTFTVDNNHGITEATPDFNWLRVGMRIDVTDSSGTNTKDFDSQTISTIVGNLVTIVSTDTEPSDGDLISREDSSYLIDGLASTPETGAMMGIDGIIDSANADLELANGLQGIDRRSATYWQAYKNTTSQVLTESLIQDGLDSIWQRTDGNEPNLVITTFALRNKLIEIVRSDRLISSMDLKAGWKAIRYIGGSVNLPILVHKFCPKGYWYYLSLSHLKLLTLKSLIWDTKGGGIIKPVADTDAYEAWFKTYQELMVDAPNSMGKYTALTTS